MTQHTLTTVGWREWVSLPQLGVPAIKAKVDTGARTSCLHVFDYEEFTRDGAGWIRFRLHPLQKNTEQEVVCEAPLLDKRHVTDSGGHKELRPTILTSVSLWHPTEQGREPFDIEITLSNRETMLFRMLLGRTALRGRLQVDSALSFTAGSPDAMELRQFYPEANLP